MFIYSEIQITRLTSLLSEERYATAYREAADFAAGQEGVNPASVIWLLGAADVNQNVGGYSAFIRNYTASQYKARYGENIDLGELQKASNDIAELVLKSIISNKTVPSINEIAIHDAQPAAERLFRGDPGGWAGNPLFVHLGHTQALLNNVLEPKGDTYDALAMLKFMSESGISWQNFNNVFKYITNIYNYGFPDDILSSGISAGLATNTFLSDAYGGLFTTKISAFFGHITIGQVINSDNLQGSQNSDFIHGGGGEDTIEGSEGHDVIDGGTGSDTVDYSLLEKPLNIVLRSDVRGTAPFVATITGNGYDTLYNIEKIIGSSADDTVIIRGFPTQLTDIDAGDGEMDTLSALYLETGVKIDEIKGTITHSGDSLSISNFESYQGTFHNDSFIVDAATVKKIDGHLGNKDKVDFTESTEAVTEDIEIIGIEHFIGSKMNDSYEADVGQIKNTLDGGGGSDTLKGGGGFDTYIVDGDDTIIDSDGEGEIIFKNITLKGPLVPKDKDECDEDGEPDDTPYKNEDGVLGASGERYKLSGGNVIVTLETGEKITVEEFNKDDFGWEFYEGDEEIDVYNDAACFRDPIIIDLDGDGLEFLALDAGQAYFDYDDNGFAERTAWASPDDGLLVVDLNDDGKITSAAELFAEQPNIGFDALATYDSNSDGVINTDDSDFADLRIWQDANSDGITDDGELRTLTEAGIASIDLAGATSGGTSETDGVEIRNTSTVTLSDGETRAVASVDFTFDNHSSRYVGGEDVDPSLSKLFSLNGYGNVRDLDVAMTEDTILRGHVEALDALTLAGATTLGQAVEAMILRWHRVEDVIEDDRGSYVDGRHVAAMEAYAGQGFSNSFVTNSPDAARSDAGAAIQASWDIYHSKVTARVLTQTELGQELFPELHYYSRLILELDADTSVTTVMERMATLAPDDTFDSLSYWVTMSKVIQTVRDQFTEQGDAFITATNAVLSANGIEYNFDILRTARVGLDDGEVIIGHNWDGESVTNFNGTAHDTLIVSGTGDDRIQDVGGVNTLVYGEGRGNDTIETGWSEEWIIDLAGLNPADVTVEILVGGVDATITIKSTGETLTIRDVMTRGEVNKSVTILYADGTEEKLGIGTLEPDLAITDGDDNVIGTRDDDIIEAGKGDDTVSGGRGSDTYVINEGDGNDIINESISNSETSTDKIQLDVNFFDVSVSFVYSSINQDSENLKLTLSDGTSVTVLQIDRDEPAIELFEFQDVTLTYEDLLQVSTASSRLKRNDVTSAETIKGTNEPTTFENTDGNQIFLGGTGDDVYQFAQGDGSNAIYDKSEEGETNKLNVGDDFADVRFGFVGRHLTMQLSDGSYLLIVNSEDNHSIDEFTFNGQTIDRTTVLAKAEIDYLTLFGTDGDDTLIADDPYQHTFYKENALIGGLGDDRLEGGKRADTYIYNSGDGSDTIYDDGTSRSEDGVRVEIDKLIIHGISASDVSISRLTNDNDDLILTLGSSGETITIKNQLGNSLPENLGVILPEGSSQNSSVSSSEIEEIIFDDSTKWTVNYLRERLVSQDTTNGSDTIRGFDETDDTLAGGLGNDIIAGLTGSDTYIYNAGDGHDTIKEILDDNSTDVLKLVGIEHDDLIISRDGLDVVLTFAGSADDSIRLTSQLSAEGGYYNYVQAKVIEKIEFDDNSFITQAQLREAAFRSELTSGDDILNGTYAAETLYFSAGNDTLKGGSGGDLYLREAHVTGNDRIEDGGITRTDTLRLEGVTSSQITASRNGIDLVLTLPNGTVTVANQFSTSLYPWDSMERIVLDDATWNVTEITASIISLSGTEGDITGDASDETLTGTSDDDTIDGKGGNDTLKGGYGSDLYIFGVGSGNDTISEDGYVSRLDIDRLQLSGLNVDDVSVTRVNREDISITINSSGETVTLTDAFNGSDETIEYVNFADGTVWNWNTLFKNAWIRGTAGDDELDAPGNSGYTFVPGAGDDEIFGGYNDGDHTFIFNKGDGKDFIQSYGGDDTIIIHGVTRDDLTFEREIEDSDGQDLIIHYGENDQITVNDQLAKTSYAPDSLKIKLDDDTVISDQEMEQAARLLGSDGVDDISGTDYDDIILAGTGDDEINGRGGSDTYIWRLGDGSDTISDYWDDLGSNILKFTNLVKSDVTLSRDSDDLLIKVNSSEETIRITDQFDRYPTDRADGVSNIEFSDGEIITRAWLEGNLSDEDGNVLLIGTEENDTLTGGALNEIIKGGDGDDTISGGKGDDYLDGDDGRDTYIWRPGDGNDTISDYSFDDEVNTLRIENAKFEDFEIQRSPEDGSNLWLKYIPTGEVLTIEYQLRDIDVIERIEFIDSATVLTQSDMDLNLPYLGTDGDDELEAIRIISNDTFQGLAGDDVLTGYLGADTYLWKVGDGNDTIIEPSPIDGYYYEESDFRGNDDLNVLRLSGVDEADIKFERDVTDKLDLLVKIQSSNEQIQLKDQLSLPNGLIKKIILDDGTEISLGSLAETLPIIGTDEAEYLTGGFASETIDAKKGDDFIDAGAGSDIIIWRSGDGNDEILDRGEFADQDILRLVDIASDGVEVTRGELPVDDFSGDPTLDDLIITIKATSETIIIRQQFSQGTEEDDDLEVGSPTPQLRALSSDSITISDTTDIPGIERIEFSDGESLSRDQISEQLDPDGVSIIGGSDEDDVLEGTSGNDILVGGDGDDGYKFDRGASEDTIVDTGGDNDFVEFGPGVTPEALTLQRINDDLLIEVGGMERLTLTVADQFQKYSDTAIEGIRFSSGLEWTGDDIKAILIKENSTNGDDVIQGFDTDDVIRGFDGNDHIIVEDGNDIVDGGDGYDIVELDGSSYRFDVVAVENGYIVTDRYSDEVKQLTNVEAIRYSYGSDETLVENSAPETGTVSANGFEDLALTILASDVISEASDADGETLSLVAVSGAVNGLVALNVDGDIIFTPDAEFSGEASFTYEITDDTHNTTGTVTIQIAAVNDTPIVVNALSNQDSLEDEDFTFVVPENTFSDIDSSELTLSATLANGVELPDWLVFNPSNSTFTGTPPENYNGAVQVVVIASDGEHTAETSFSFNIAPVNDAPVNITAIEDKTVTAGQPISVELPENTFVDVDNDVLIHTAKLTDGSDLPQWLTIDVATGDLTGTPPAGTDETYSISITASDGKEEVSSNFNLTIEAGNTAPIVANEIEDRSSKEDELVSFTIPDNAFSDADDDDLTYSASGMPSWLAFDADSRSFSGTPPQDFFGSIDVTVTASDGSLEASDTFTLDITAVNDAPIVANEIEDLSSKEDELVSFTLPDNAFSDVDNSELTLTATGQPDWLTFNASSRSFSGTPPTNFNGSIDVTVTASDGSLEASDTFTLDITAVNDAPIVANEIEDLSSKEDELVSFTLPDNAFSDVDSNLTLRTSPLPAWLIFNAATRTFTGTPPQDFFGSLDVTVTASDGDLEVSDTFTLVITSVNDGPVAVDDTDIEADAGVEQIILASDLLANDSDVEGDDLNIVAVSSTSGNATVSLNAEGNVVYTASEGFDGDDSFIYTVSDGNGGIARATVSLSVDGNEPNPYEGWQIGTEGRDVIYGDWNTSNRIYGNDGDDKLVGGSKSDQIDGGKGNDAINGLGGDDIINGNEGNDRIWGSSGNDTLSGGEGRDMISGGWGDDTINGDAGNDSLHGNVGDDTINGGDGNDWISGSWGNDIISGGEGGDTVSGGAGNDLINGDAGNDRLYGNSGNDTINGGDGNDRITGSWGNDIISGGEGVDTVSGGTGNDLINGDAGNDKLYGNSGNDTINGGDGNDRITGSWGNDIISGGEGVDTVSGGTGNDLINGDAGNDRLYGNSGNDTINGGAGNDTITGSWGNDTLSGGEGNDQLWGGWGQDTFVFNTGDGADTVRDFSTGYNWWWFRVAGDIISLDVDGIENYDDLMDVASQEGRHTKLDFGGDDSLTLNYTRLSSLNQDDFAFV